MAPTGVTQANARLIQFLNDRAAPLAAINVAMASAPKGLCKMTAKAVPRPNTPPRCLRIRGHRGRHRQPVKHRVERQSQRNAHPTETPGGSLGQRMGVSARLERTTLGDIVVVKGQKPLEEEHHEEAGQQPRRTLVDGVEFMNRVREEAQHR